jgi:predicted Ser/Thr protein kinase
MTTLDPKTAWDRYCTEELAHLTPILTMRGYSLDSEQKHMQGERYLMHAVTTTSGRKLILSGTTSDGTRVIIKATRDSAGKKEIEHERMCRDFLKRIDFAGEVFHTPEEIAFFETEGCTITIQRFIPQECSFLERPITEQFSLALRAFKGQESAHATTAKHRHAVTTIYGMRDAQVYQNTLDSFYEKIGTTLGDTHPVCDTLSHAREMLNERTKIIEQYCGFLTHTDFVPHNIRIQHNTIYLLDFSSLTFGNKYEGWARFINFMTLYNPPLQKALEQYVRDNRTPEESVSLRMMRIYRLGEILWYYVRATAHSTGDLYSLNTARIVFWHTILQHVLSETEVPPSVIETYTRARDSLRSADEKRRQVGLH